LTQNILTGKWETDARSGQAVVGQAHRRRSWPDRRRDGQARRAAV